MPSNRFELSTHCAVLPALFIGRMESKTQRKPLPTALEMEYAPKWIVSITQPYGGHAICLASGVGIFLPLTSSPLNGPLVDLLRLFGEYNNYYFMNEEERKERTNAHCRLALNPAQDDVDIVLSRMKDHEKSSFDLMLSKFASKYPHLRELTSDFYQRFIHKAAYTTGEAFSESTRRELDGLLGQFTKLPKISDQSCEALAQFDGPIEDLVLEWPCLDRGNPLGFQPVAARDCFDDLRSFLGGNENIYSYLLWENCD